MMDGDDIERKVVIRTKGAPEPAGAYSQGIRIGDLLFCSGQIGMDPETGRLEEGVEAQTERCLRNLAAVLQEGGTSMDHVIRCRVYITDISNFKRVDSVYSRFFGTEGLPARVMVGVASLPLGAEVEIEAVASI